MFESLVPLIKERLTKHHELYSAQCKAEYWEEHLCYQSCLKNWKVDYEYFVFST